MKLILNFYSYGKVAELEEASKLVASHFTNSGISFGGPIPWKKEIKKVTFSTSPHKHKNTSQISIERRIHKRKIMINKISLRELEFLKRLIISKVPRTIKIDAKDSEKKAKVFFLI